jgi:hypothetical protein
MNRNWTRSASALARSLKIRFMLPFVAVFALVTAAYAGGWAIITVNHLPEYAVAGETLALTFSVRQHGKTLLSDLHPRIQATAPGGRTTKVAATRTTAPGEYSARPTFPEPGEWTITIVSGFNTSTTTLPVLKVVGSGSPPPPPFSPATRGVRLFTSKGCAGCHRHIEVNPERTTDPKFDLTGKRFPIDYLRKFLADPSIKPAEMPNLNLNSDEIDSLVAFIDKLAAKSIFREPGRNP